MQTQNITTVPYNALRLSPRNVREGLAPARPDCDAQYVPSITGLHGCATDEVPVIVNMTAIAPALRIIPCARAASP